MTTMTTTRRALLASAAAAPLAAVPALALAAQGADAALIRDCDRWLKLQARIVALLRERREIEEELRPRWNRLVDCDPRGAAEHPPTWISLDRLMAFERVYVARGLGRIADELDAVWLEQDAIDPRIREARPATLAGALARALAFATAAATDALVNDHPEDLSLNPAFLAMRALEDAVRLAGGAEA